MPSRVQLPSQAASHSRGFAVSVSNDSDVVGPISPNLSAVSGSLWLIGVVFVFVGELFARENLVLSGQELIERRTLREPD